jgi:enamine deaminase RidA (YjgF/YER057c/UK114 family)
MIGMTVTPVSPASWHWTSGSDYTPAMRAGNMIITSGIPPLDVDGSLVGEGDIEAQIRQTVRNLDLLLGSAGSSLDRILRQMVCLKRESDVGEFLRLRPELYTPPYPASVLIVVTAHARPDMLVEIACEALVKDDAS